MRVELPESFEKRMKEMLGDEYEAYIESYDNPRQYGLRINPMKITEEELAEGSGFSLGPIPWTKTGYFYKEENQPARHPYYSAGLYYLQEPSAMTPAAKFPVKPGERVLDLCAAPGGKATALGAALQGKGVLVANDISNSRAKALLKNLEVFGISNAFVTNEVPQNLADRFEGFFDKVLIDAPCSGEGMFRKDPAVIKTWDEERPEYFAKLQNDILKNGVRMLRPGGKLLYSTCTFAPVENEGSISWILNECPEMELLPIEGYEGFSEGNPAWGDGREELRRCVRIWPHKMKGEGHFLALMKKSEDAPETRIKLEAPTRMDKKNKTGMEEFFKDRFEPSQQLAMTLKASDYAGSVSLSPEDERIGRYLRGETLLLEPGEATREKGWILVCVDQYALGWGKLVNGVLKNKYWSGWRLKG